MIFSHNHFFFSNGDQGNGYAHLEAGKCTRNIMAIAGKFIVTPIRFYGSLCSLAMIKVGVLWDLWIWRYGSSLRVGRYDSGKILVFKRGFVQILYWVLWYFIATRGIVVIYIRIWSNGEKAKCEMYLLEH